MSDSKYCIPADICGVMNTPRLGWILFTAIAFTILFASCEKKESAVRLPPAGSALHSQVSMGENYQTQIFFDFEGGQVVYTSAVNAWDLAFEAGSNGRHAFMNGGKAVKDATGIFIANTSDTSFANVNATNYSRLLSNLSDGAWKFDWPCGLPDSTGIGEWTDKLGNSLKQVYIIHSDSATYMKIRLRSVDDSRYVLEYGALNDVNPSVIEINKNYNYNYIYFSFTQPGNIVTLDPPLNTWDIVFTRYRTIYRYLNNFPYQVSGVLLNPYNTTGVADSTSGFENMNAAKIPSYEFTNARDVIGFDWKSYDYTNSAARYIVNPKKCYVVKTRKGQYWKIHFLDYYSSTGIKGSPLFEYERIQ